MKQNNLCLLSLMTLAMLFSACSPSINDVSDTKEKIDTSISVVGDTVPDVDKTFDRAQIYLERGLRDKAYEDIKQYINSAPPTEVDKKYSYFWSSKRPDYELGLAVLFSEVLADRDVTTHNPSYIVGNSYFHGRGVEQNYEKALKYWTRPILHDVQEVQESVANIYGDSDGDFYDPEKESEYRARVKN